MTPEQTALDPANLEFSLDQIQQMTHAVLTHVLDHHAELADRPIREISMESKTFVGI